MRFNKKAWQRWCLWLTRVRDDLGITLSDHKVFVEFRQVMRENAAWIVECGGDYFCDFITRCYRDRAILGIRRHVKDDETLSLVRLLGQVENCAPQISYERYLNLFPPSHSYEWQKDVFASASEDGCVLSAAIIGADQRALQEVAKVLEHYADTVVAHLDKKQFTGDLYWADLDAACETFDRIARKYILLLTGDYYADSIKPALVVPWQRVFDFPLRRPNSRVT